ncbi:MAG: hypothetical protein LUQ19_03345 [Methanoregula sp.]|nr:hypothetical protein [Methanoregula sp.]
MALTRVHAIEPAPLLLDEPFSRPDHAIILPLTRCLSPPAPSVPGLAARPG